MLGVISAAIDARLGNIKADVYMGDSIGSLISAMRAVGKTPDEVLTLFNENAADIFDHSTLDAVEDMQGFSAAKYRSEPLRSALRKSIGDMTFGDLDCHLIMPAWSLTQDGPYWFHKGQDDHVSIIDAVMASCACPMFFPSYPIMYMGQNFGDGGWICHAPADKAAFWFHPEDVDAILSIGTGLTPECEGRMTPLDWGLVSWFQHDIISAFTRLREKESNQNCRMFFGDKYRSINPPCEKIAIDDVSKIARMIEIGNTADLGDVPQWLAAKGWQSDVPTTGKEA